MAAVGVLGAVVTASSARSKHAVGRGDEGEAIVLAGAQRRIVAWCLQDRREIDRKELK